MSKIRSTTDKKRQKACKLLEKEFDIVKKIATTRQNKKKYSA